jgi:translation initiation factor IF-1
MVNNNSKRDRIELEGVVIDSAKGKFRVKINGENEHIVLATLSGKIRQNVVRILISDKVIVEVSPYDLYSGRIIRRLKQ